MNQLPRIRPIALCIFRRGDSVFVSEGHDSKKGETFYRPIGGGIEFGEFGRQAIAREVKEEIGAEITDVRLLGVLENLFTYEGRPGHELVMVYEGRFVDPAFEEDVERSIIEDGRPVGKALWKPLAEFLDARLRLYPEGLLDVLRAEGGSA